MITAVPVCCGQGPHIYTQFVAVNITILFTVFKDSVGNGFLLPADVLHVTNIFLGCGSCAGEIEDSTSFCQNVYSVTAIVIQFILLN